MESKFNIGDSILWIGGGHERIKGFITSKDVANHNEYFYHSFTKAIRQTEYAEVAFLYSRIVITEKTLKEFK